MVYAKELKNGNVVGLYTYSFDPHFEEGSGMVIITEDEYESLLLSFNPSIPETDEISDSEALAIITEMTRDKAYKFRALVLKGSAGLTDAEVSTAPEVLRTLSGDGSIVEAGERINWNGDVKRAKSALWDRAEYAPDAAPDLWDDIDYVDGVRKIPVTDSGIFDASLAFAEGEEGYSTADGLVYVSRVNGNVYTPQLVPDNWDLREEVTE